MTVSDNPSALRSQSEITQSLLSLMHQHPYSEITVKQIVLESRLAKKTFYRNFSSKDDVLLSLIRRNITDYLHTVNTAQGGVLDTIFGFAAKNRELLTLLDKNGLLHLPLRCMNELIPDIAAEQDKQHNPFVPLFDGLEPEYLIALNTGAAWNVITLWIHSGADTPPDSIKAAVREYLSRISAL